MTSHCRFFAAEMVFKRRLWQKLKLSMDRTIGHVLLRNIKFYFIKIVESGIPRFFTLPYLLNAFSRSASLSLRSFRSLLFLALSPLRSSIMSLCLSSWGSSRDTWGGVVLQWCYRGVTGVLQWCYSGVTVVLQWCNRSVTLSLQHYQKGNWVIGAYNLLVIYYRGGQIKLDET